MPLISEVLNISHFKNTLLLAVRSVDLIYLLHISQNDKVH